MWHKATHQPPTCLYIGKSSVITKPAENEGKTPELTKGKRQCASDKDSSAESNETEPQNSTDPVDDPTTGTAAVVPLPKRKILTFPKCPHRDKLVNFELGPGFIIEEERSTQNAGVKESNVMTTKRSRRKPVEYVAVPTSQKGNQLAASAIVLCTHELPFHTKQRCRAGNAGVTGRLDCASEEL